MKNEILIFNFDTVLISLFVHLLINPLFNYLLIICIILSSVTQQHSFLFYYSSNFILLQYFLLYQIPQDMRSSEHNLCQSCFLCRAQHSAWHICLPLARYAKLTKNDPRTQRTWSLHKGSVRFLDFSIQAGVQTETACLTGV